MEQKTTKQIYDESSNEEKHQLADEVAELLLQLIPQFEQISQTTGMIASMLKITEVRGRVAKRIIGIEKLIAMNTQVAATVITMDLPYKAKVIAETSPLFEEIVTVDARRNNLAFIKPQAIWVDLADLAIIPED